MTECTKRRPRDPKWCKVCRTGYNALADECPCCADKRNRAREAAKSAERKKRGPLEWKEFDG